MVVNIYNVIIKIIGLGLMDNYQAYINIYDNNNRIYQGKTYNGELHINLERNRAYGLVAYNNRKRIVTSFYISDSKNKYIFSLNEIIGSKKTITFQLKDANYKNLPIEKGKMLFGKDN